MDNKQKLYEEYRLRWMLDHGHTLTEMIDELQMLREEGDPEQSLQSLFRDWEFGYGFGSEIWACFDEFLENEYLVIKQSVVPHAKANYQNRRGALRDAPR